MFSVKCDPEIKPTSIKPGEQIFMNVEHFLPFQRFLPKKPGEKTQGQKGGPKGQRGGRGQGGFRPQRGGKPQRGGQSGGYRPPRGGNSGGYRPPKKN